MKLSEPVNYIRSDWIRPEDLGHYEALGYDRFKIAERNAPTDVMVRRVRAYNEGRGLFWNLRTFLRPWVVYLLRLLKIRRLAEVQGMLNPLRGQPPVVVDNRALDGFLDFFSRVDCHELDCEECRHCHRVAERAVRIDPGFRREVLRRYDEVLDDLRSGAMWSYGQTVRKEAYPVHERK